MPHEIWDMANHDAQSLSAVSPQGALNIEAVTFEVDDRPRSNRLMCVVTPAQPERAYLGDGKKNGSYSEKQSDDTSEVDTKSERDIKVDVNVVESHEANESSKASPWASFALGAFVGVFPPVLLVRVFAKKWVDKWFPTVDGRWFRYGRSLGLLILVLLCISVAVLRIN